MSSLKLQHHPSPLQDSPNLPNSPIDSDVEASGGESAAILQEHHGQVASLFRPETCPHPTAECSVDAVDAPIGRVGQVGQVVQGGGPLNVRVHLSPLDADSASHLNRRQHALTTWLLAQYRQHQDQARLGLEPSACLGTPCSALPSSGQAKEARVA